MAKAPTPKKNSLPPVEPLTADQLRGGIQAIQQVTQQRGRSDINAAELMSWMKGQLDELEDTSKSESESGDAQRSGDE
jgi:hypothetical protein